VIVVDDGSEDGTSELVKHHYGDRVKVIRFERNQGKGAAVKSGMLAARGDFVVVMDADNSLPIQNLNFALPYLEDYDSILPSRQFLPEYNVGLVRKVGHKVFSWYVNRMLGLGVQDPQCGFKVFRRKAVLPCVEQMVQKRWVYDSELLYLAKQRGLRIKEVPIQFNPSSRPSRLRVLKSAPGMFWQIFLIRLIHGRKRNRWLLFFFLVLLGVLLPFYGHVLLSPHRYLADLQGDSVKNFFTFGYHVKWDSSYWHFSGFNYPYGELLPFTDGAPLLSNLFKLLKHVFPFFDHYPVEIYYLYLFFLFSCAIFWFFGYLWVWG